MALVENKKDIVFVCGMHRSGTSFLTEALGEMGLQVPISAMDKAPDNPRGFFEPTSIFHTHESALVREGLSWASEEILQFSRQDAEHFPETIQELKANLKMEFPEETPLALKDPRLCISMQIWNRIIEDLGVKAY